MTVGGSEVQKNKSAGRRTEEELSGWVFQEGKERRQTRAP